MRWMRSGGIKRSPEFSPGGNVSSSYVGRGLLDAPFRWFSAGVFRRLRAASSFARGGKGTKTPPGDGSGWTLRVHIRLTPGPPLRGTLSCLMLLNFRRAKMEWPPRFLPGHWALGLQKLPLMRFKNCAWVSRINAPGAGYAVGAALAVARDGFGISFRFSL